MPQAKGRNAFDRSRRIALTRDFRKAYASNAFAADENLAVYVVANGLECSRLGLSVGRRCGGAVVRNRVKRLVREAFRTQVGLLPAGYDFVVVSRTRTCNLDYRAVKSSLLDCARRACARWARQSHLP